MIKNLKFNFKHVLVCSFILLQTVFYIAFMTGDIKNTFDTTIIKYVSIITCLVFILINIPFNLKDGVVLSVAFLFTIIADLFLLVLNNHYVWGLVAFIIAQTVYFIRICFINKKSPNVSLAVRIVLVVFVLLILKLNGLLDLLTALVVVYFTMLVVNMVQSLFLLKFGKKYVLFFIGLLLFIGCDISVGLNNFSAVLGISLDANLISFVSVAMWGFYLPSQTLIALSVVK